MLSSRLRYSDHSLARLSTLSDTWPSFFLHDEAPLPLETVEHILRLIHLQPIRFLLQCQECPTPLENVRKILPLIHLQPIRCFL
jgi:hypothetical protein